MIRVRFFILGVLAVALVFGSPPVHAKTVFEALMSAFSKKGDGEPGPEDTLQAPFSYEAPVVEGQSDAANEAALDTIHRRTEEIGEWLMTVASEVLTFDGEDYNADIKEAAGYFDAKGQKEYTAFLQQAGLLNTLDSEQYQVRSFVQEAPLLLNEGAVDKRYRWLYRVRVMTSYLPRGASDYKEMKPINRTMVVTLQVGRTDKADNEHDILIESWSGKVEKWDKK